ncbi:leucine-rich PPR motif-containing protein, mitochondrial-like [Macrobrachium nipponense]|uniref:leucine-rich PPR motif-containing protein, mitochondrial-like n=1 Tax=Macrobrachium nipponense TaxID=159736 RepID=UPI0030C7C399
MASRIQLYKFALRTLRVTRKYVPPTLANRGCRECMSANWTINLRRYVYTAVPNETIEAQATENPEGKSEVFQILSILQMKKDRLGPLNITDIKTGIEKLKRQNVELSGSDFLQLLQMTIKAVEMEYRNCSDVVQQLLELYKTGKEKPLTLGHLELYFKMCLLAEVPLSSKVMLSLVEDNNIDVTRELLEIMMLILGRNGRIDDTADILTFMKQKGFPITEVIFSGIIFAHGFNRDLDGINSVVETMRNVKMDFTSITYHALMTAYAVAGEFPRVGSLVQQMNRAKVACTLSQLKSLLLDVVKSNEAGEDFENMDYVLELMKQKGTLDLAVIVLHLIHHNHAPEAVRLLSSHLPVLKNTEYYNNARIYIQEMVHCLKDVDLLVEMCQQLEQDEINKYATLVALETAFIEHKEEVAWALLQSLKNNGKPLRQHYFWPLLNGSQSLIASKLIDYVHNMVTLGIPPDVETLSEFVIPNLTLKDPQSIEHTLKGAGLSVTLIAAPLLTVLIRNNMIDKAIEYAKNLRVDFSSPDLTAALAKTWTSSPKSAISLLAMLIQKAKEHEPSGNLKEDWGGQFLLDIASSRNGLNKHQIVPLFKELKKNNIGISEISADYLVGRANASIQEELKENVHMIVDKSLGHPPKEQDYNFMPHPNDMTIEELEGHLIELQSKGFKTRGTIRRLILLHASENNTERVLSLMRVLEEMGEKMSPGVLASILNAYISVKNFDAALDVYNGLRQAHPSFALDKYKVIDFSTALVKHGRIEEAVKILEEVTPYKGNTVDEKRQVRRNCQALLMAAAATCKYEVVTQIFDILKSKNIIKIDKLMLGALVKCRLNSGDYIGTVEEVRSIKKKFKCLPMKIEVLIHLLHNIKKTEAEADSLEESRSSANKLLEEMLNIIASVSGSTNAQHDLLFACLEAGYPSQATQVLRSLGRKINESQIQRQCQRYAGTAREEPLLNFLISCRSIPGIRREEIFNSLLDIYHVQNDGRKGLSLWTRMQEENVLPSKAFLGTLASLLASNDIDIPYEVSWSV